MYIVCTYGGTKAMRELAEDVVEFTCRALMPRKRTLNIDIEIKDTLKDGAWGFCCSYNDQHTIELHNKMDSLYEYIATICHECVHVQQHCMGILNEVRGKQMWKGSDYTEVAYSKQPWEKEAFAMQHKLAKAYLKHRGITITKAKTLSPRRKII